MVKKMLSICDEGHWDGDDGCVANRRAVTRPTIPTRLIDLHSNNSQNWSLIETEDRNDFPKYVALSHRWTTDTPRLLKSNYLEFQRDQPDKALPRSYQDVFTLCRSLHIQYVWIDSLCIFQDSSDDFLHEAATMTEVYANAFCTFSICWESPSGFLRPREPRTLTRWRIFDHDMHALEHRYVFVQDKKEWQTSIGLTPVNQRGWVLQERLLSPRVLYLGNDQLYWQCDAAEACETAPEGIQDGVYVSERKNILDHANRNHFYWQDLVVKFMGLDLTFERDRLLAISGVARSLLSPVARTPPVGSNPELDEKKTEKSPQTVEYVAGLQRVYWIQDLLWFPAINTMLPDIKKIDSGSFNRQPDNDVPSWSWAACPGPIQWTVRIYPGDTKSNERMPGPEGGPMAYLRNINFEPLGSDVYGLPKSASLEISCLLVQARHAVVEKTDDLYEGIGSPTDPTKDMCFYVNSDGFLLPLPYPRAHSDESSTLAVILEPCTDIKPTCFIVPLLHARTWTEPRITGLVVQEVTRSHSKMREFVRIGSFGKRYGFGPDEVIHALLKKLPAEGDEFEQKLRDSAQVWKDTEGTMYSKDTREKGTAKAAWTTIRLV
ncbi:hypothetical protein NW768_006785 [Fusarium equiseti]|uniref:Heterokaryon incompatibility domain-containing protein n=1 Tax=Fusarium equiseti TaxID=61235 RepID=A0ABQ8R959_FUSEQ|nr:hypothetical protein NW768_006785 [Fusarium equiseti]